MKIRHYFTEVSLSCYHLITIWVIKVRQYSLLYEQMIDWFQIPPKRHYRSIWAIKIIKIIISPPSDLMIYYCEQTAVSLQRFKERLEGQRMLSQALGFIIIFEFQQWEIFIYIWIKIKRSIRIIKSIINMRVMKITEQTWSHSDEGNRGSSFTSISS